MFNRNKDSKKAKVYVTPNGGQSVRVDELLQNPEVLEELKAIQAIIEGDVVSHSKEQQK